jgi:hypothetical protein
VSDRLFTPGPASDPWYSGLRDSSAPRSIETRDTAGRAGVESRAVANDLENSPALLEPAPCDGCWHARRCAAERLACEAFARFTAGEPAIRWAAINRTPTRARYEALL